MQEEKNKTKDKTYTLTYTEQEIQRRIAEIQNSEEFNLFIKVDNGRFQFEQLQKLLSVLPKAADNE